MKLGQTVLHLLFKNLHLYPENQIMEVLNLLLAQSTLNLSAVDERRVFPLMAAVNDSDTTLAIKIIERLNSRGVWWEQTDRLTGESALDKVVKRDRFDIFIALIRLRAGIRINVDAAQAFMEKHQAHPEMATTSQILQGRQPELAYRVSIGALATSTKVDNKQQPFNRR